MLIAYGFSVEQMLFLLALGAFSGLMAGLLGVGGGLILVPALIVIFEALGFSPDYLTQMAVATSLATIVFTSLSSIRSHHQAGYVDWPIVKTLTIGVVVGAVLGALFASELSGRVLQLALGLFAILVSAQMFFQFKAKPLAMPSKWLQSLSGLVIAFVSAIFGIGGGSLSVPLLNSFGLDMKKSVAVSAACGLPIALFAIAGFYVASLNYQDLPRGSLGFIYVPALVAIILSSTLSAHFGAKLAHRLPAATLKKVFSLLLFCIGVRFILKTL